MKRCCQHLTGDSLEPPLTCTVHHQLNSVTATEWNRLFPGLPDPIELAQFIQYAGLEGFSFRSLIVRERNQVLLYLPLFETTYNLSQIFEGRMRTIAAAAAKRFPRVLCVRALGIGFVEGEWGQIGYDPDASPRVLEKAWDLALDAIDQMADSRRIGLIAFVNFTAESGRIIPAHKLRRFAPLVGLPYGQVPIVYPTLDAYLASCSKSTRTDLRRKLRKAEGVTIQRTRDPAPWLDQIYRWYLQTTERGEAVFAVHSRDYFARVCEAVPHAEYVLYFVEGTLAAFNLVVEKPDMLVDKYFAMDEILGRQYALYFVSWIENIRYCIAHQIPLYHAGQGAEATKHRLKARLLPNIILFRHRNPVVHQLLKLFVAPLASHPRIDVGVAQLGMAWRLAVPSARAGEDAQLLST